MKRLLHIVVVLVSLFVLLGVPALFYSDAIGARLSGVDAVSGATVEVPDQPSGEFAVLINIEKHPDTLEQWRDFFTEKPVDVIFEDIDCLVVDGDAAAKQLAQRYQSRLAENQMSVRSENGMLTVSKAQWGEFDVIILSKEMAQAYNYDTVYNSGDVTLITVKGGDV